MKLLNIFIGTAAILSLAACSNDDDKNFTWNTKDGVTVSMENPEMVTIENLGLFRVPVKVSGEPNGYIKVNFACYETGDNPAFDDINYVVTTKSVVVAPEDDEFYVEVNTIDNNDENDPRTFSIAISEVEYASIGDLPSTEIIIKDKGPYSKMSGQWNIAYLDYDGNPVSGVVNFRCADPNERVINVDNFPVSGAKMSLRLNWVWDEAAQHGDVEIPMGMSMGTVNFTGLGECEVWPILSPESTSGSILGVCNSNYSTVTFDANDRFYFGVFLEGGYQGLWDSCSELSFSRKVE